MTTYKTIPPKKTHTHTKKTHTHKTHKKTTTTTAKQQNPIDVHKRSQQRDTDSEASPSTSEPVLHAIHYTYRRQPNVLPSSA